MSQIPFSNPAGNNQTNPGTGMTGIKAPINIPGAGTGIHGSGGDNPYSPIPLSTGLAPSAPTTGSGIPHHAMNTGSSGAVPAGGVIGAGTGTNSPTGATINNQGSVQNGFITQNSSYANGQNDLQKQLIDIYGKGVGGSLFSLLGSMSGTNSQVLQDFIKSLQPQEAAASANIGASLGAAGVSANSSVNAIAQGDLQAQEFAAIAGESAKLTMNQEELTAHLLSRMEGSASKEVASSGWQVLGDVLQAGAGVAETIVGGMTANPALIGAGIKTTESGVQKATDYGDYSDPSASGDGGTGW